MKDWRFALIAAVGAVIGSALLFRPQKSQQISKAFEEGRSLIPLPPLGGVPIWIIRLLGMVYFGDAALFAYLFVKSN